METHLENFYPPGTLCLGFRSTDSKPSQVLEFIIIIFTSLWRHLASPFHQALSSRWPWPCRRPLQAPLSGFGASAIVCWHQIRHFRCNLANGEAAASTRRRRRKAAAAVAVAPGQCAVCPRASSADDEESSSPLI